MTAAAMEEVLRGAGFGAEFRKLRDSFRTPKTLAKLGEGRLDNILTVEWTQPPHQWTVDDLKLILLAAAKDPERDAVEIQFLAPSTQKEAGDAFDALLARLKVEGFEPDKVQFVWNDLGHRARIGLFAVFEVRTAPED
ncbi:hypothetical protein A3A39_02135 [Candidatus Kaiserbacteria bacterium RIFCSPLOWO2_01_FULL_54_13]|uniref:Uncharacterized protein n=1 Tax=Candidatus Kaiserbacteria bacterium RIFCSPLOWO2_01_FULL_54_13 TaxID=1798512 RepID=A0A1F6F170_9BACT|nr:MAG: hypothetical protein A3A39_02135 [Candidatus Kaiserbacteria bacterium RIFCSPLOWO2_01_FULL_54_13]